MSDKFNSAFNSAVSSGRVTEALGRQMLFMADFFINKSKLRNRPDDTKQIVSSDIVLDMVKTANRLIESGSAEKINNPYGYFANSIRNMLATILQYRFSTKRTQDVFGKPITTRGKNNKVILHQFFEILEVDEHLYSEETKYIGIPTKVVKSENLNFKH